MNDQGGFQGELGLEGYICIIIVNIAGQVCYSFSTLFSYTLLDT